MLRKYEKCSSGLGQSYSSGESHSKLAKEYPLKYNQDGKLKPQFVIQEICELTNGEAYIATEVGQTNVGGAHISVPYLAGLYPRGLGTMGFAQQPLVYKWRIRKRLL